MVFIMKKFLACAVLPLTLAACGEIAVEEKQTEKPEEIKVTEATYHVSDNLLTLVGSNLDQATDSQIEDLKLSWQSFQKELTDGQYSATGNNEEIASATDADDLEQGQYAYRETHKDQLWVKLANSDALAFEDFAANEILELAQGNTSAVKLGVGSNAWGGLSTDATMKVTIRLGNPSPKKKPSNPPKQELNPEIPQKKPSNPPKQQSSPKQSQPNKAKPQANVKVSDQKPLLWSKILDKTETWRPQRRHHASVSFQDKMWIFGGNSARSRNDIWSSADGKNWKREKEHAEWPATNFLKVFEFQNKLWLIGGRREGDIWVSSDGVQWTKKASPDFLKNLWRFDVTVFNNAIWITGGYDWEEEVTRGATDGVWTSANGVEWTQVTSDSGWEPRLEHTTFVFDDKLWVMGGNARFFTNDKPLKDLWSSSDGKSWTKEKDDLNIDFPEQVIFDNKIWLLDSDDTVWYSTNGQDWQDQAQIQGFGLHEFSSLVFQDKIWVIDKDARSLLSSADGKTWNIESPNYWAPNTSSVVFKDKIWTLGGFCGQECWNNNVWSSADGVNWTEEQAAAPWKPRYNHTSVVFKDRIWVIGGYQSWEADIWSSADGKTWQKEVDQVDFSDSQRWIIARMTSLVFKDRIWVLGAGDTHNGNYKKIYSSDDGKNWREEGTFNFPFRHASLVFQNKMWILDSEFKGAWSSADGNTWTKESTLPSDSFNNFYAVVLDKRIWIFGGSSSTGKNSPVYSSADGKTWQKEKTPVPWVGSSTLASALVFQDKIYVLGGFNGQKVEYENIVWKAELETE